MWDKMPSCPTASLHTHAENAVVLVVGSSAMFSALNLCGISGNVYTKTCGACRDMTHAKKSEMPHRFDLWDKSLRSQSATELNAILTCTKKLGHFGIKNTIISAP